MRRFAPASETGPFGDRAPWSVEVGAGLLAVRAGAVPSNDVGADAIEPREHRKCRCIQSDRFRTGLAVGKQEQSAFKVHIFPFEF